MNPTCYIINYDSHYLSAFPAEIVRETKTTITAKSGDMEKTFQKRKQWGKDEYEDPRVLDGQEFEFRSDLTERGHSSSYHLGYRLTFDVERVQERLAREKTAKERRDKARKVAETVETYFRNHRNGHGDYSDDAAFVAVLGKLEKALEGVEVK